MLAISHIFGRAGEVFPPLVDSIINEVVDTPYAGNLPPGSQPDAASRNQGATP